MRTSTRLARVGGLAAVLGGTLWVAKVLHETNDVTPYPRDVTDHLFFVVPLLLLAGLAGLVALHRGRPGTTERDNRAGFFVAGFGLVVVSASIGLWSLGVIPDVLRGILLGLVPVALGLIIVGSSAMESGALSRAKGLPLALGFVSILAIIAPPWNVAGVILWTLLGLGWILLGMAVWAGGARTTRTARAR